MTALLSNKLILIGLTIILTLLLSIFLIRKYKLSRYQVFVFILLVLFWSAINIIRAYRKNYATGTIADGGLGLDGAAAATMAAAYGLISIFVRLPVFALSDFFKSRKFFIALALLFVFGSSIMVIIDPSYESLYWSSLALGVGASLLSLFNVMFAETFSASQAIFSVSILSVAPLLAEFLMSPLQYLATSNKPIDYGFMWTISAVLSALALMFLFFVKDNKKPTRNFTWVNVKKALSNPYFLLLSLLGIVVSFVRFASSGSNMNNFAKTELISMSPLLIAYVELVYSLSQLVAGVLVGIILKKKIGVKNTLILGLSLSGIFTLLASSVTHPTTLFWLNALNGFGYGLTYNVLLGMAMQPFAVGMREVTMGIYQTFFAVGIYYGDKIYALLAGLVDPSLSAGERYQTVFGWLSVVSVCAVIFVLLVFNKRSQAYLEA
ncbi:MAG: major facilitator superfamily protein [Erysipelotrichaceae bacterium]|nr:MAG: major facilitator superfamily [Erysipelotrichaceae bacterium]TXT17442.1 MAG: major facilitator superfamily protein [Erysipelotrichaceae bacterium]